MPDIRSFFGGKPAAAPVPKPAPAAKPKGRGRKVIEDDEDDDDIEVVEVKKPARESSTPQKKTVAPTPVEETTADDYFGKGTKPKRTEAVRPKAKAQENGGGIEYAGKVSPKKRAGAGVAKKKKEDARRAKAEAELNADDFPDDDMEMEDVVENAKAEVMVGRRAGDDYKEEVVEQEVLPTKKRDSGRGRKAKTEDEEEFKEDVNMKDDEDDFVVPDDDGEDVKPAKRKAASNKRKSAVLDDDDDDLEMEEVKPAAKKRAAPAKKAPAAKKAKKEEPEESAEMKAIMDSIPTIEPPPPPPKDDDAPKPKFQFGGGGGNSAAPASAIDPSDYPQGEDNCLAGLTFVFTGQLASLGREQGQALVKQYGGKCPGVPSRKTSFVVLGEDAGPKKLQVIADFKLRVINEEGLFELIRKLPANGGDSAAAAKNDEKRKKEEQEIKKAALQMDLEEKARLAALAKNKKPELGTSSPAKAKADRLSNGNAASKPKQKAPETPAVDTRLWTVRYAPTQLAQICGNKGQVEKMQRWLRAFPRCQHQKFKLAGADGSGTFRAIMIHGPPGIGKTTAAHLVAKLEGYDVVESNASDTRSKKLVESGLKGVLSTTSLLGYFGRGDADAEASKKKLVLIMDEVDGMSAGDRGGVGALAAVCKKSQIPMILICNDRKLPKMKPFDFVTYDIPFRRPTTDMIRSRISTIAFREGLKLPQNVMNALIEGAGADIRQVVNMLSTAKLSMTHNENETGEVGKGQTMDHTEASAMSKQWEKHIVLKPWDMVAKILGPGIWNASAKASLNDKQELYFNDHEFAPLMLQENYMGTTPQRANQYSANPKLRALVTLDLTSKAAESISDGDMVDRMIHGSQQQWSLMPVHAMLSFVRPASFINGSMAGHGQTRFTQWLGKNSSQGKLTRLVKDIQGHMRLRVTADRHEIRQTYLPILFEKLVKKLQNEGKEAVPDVIEVMDQYYLTKDDFDAILELGVGDADQDKIKIETQTKATFTRMYNAQSHPLPFMKSSSVLAPRRAPAKEKPDLEEAQEESADEGLE